MPLDGDASRGELRDLRERRLTEIDVAERAARTLVDDAHHHRILWTRAVGATEDGAGAFHVGEDGWKEPEGEDGVERDDF